MLKTNSCKCPKSLAQYHITLGSCFLVCTVIGVMISNAAAAVYICFWNRCMCSHIGMMTVPWSKGFRHKQIPEMHSMASLYPRAAPECVSMVCHRTWRACSGSFRKRKKNVINVAFECIRCIYIYKADHPRCKFIGLRFLSCFFLSKKKASTEGANISVWGLFGLYYLRWVRTFD